MIILFFHLFTANFVAICGVETTQKSPFFTLPDPINPQFSETNITWLSLLGCLPVCF